MKRILFACFFAHASALVAQIHFDEAQSELALWDTVSVGMVIKPAGSWDYSGSTRKNFSALGKYENLDVSQVFTLCMDKHQNVWIGGGLGEVVRYNGRTFEYFTLGCFSTNPIYKIFEDAEGNMWFGSLADGLVKYDGHHCMRLRPGAHFHLETIGVFDITGDPEGVVWISTNGNGLIGIKGDRVMRIDAPSPLADHSVTCSAIDDEHSLWCGYYNAGISCLGNGTALHFDQDDGLVSNKVFALYNWQGRVLAGTRNGLYICSAQNGIQLLPWSQGVFIFDMSEDQDNNLWIATNGSGLVRLRDTGGTDGLLTPEWFTEADGLLNNRLLDVMCDNDGNVWLGTFGNGVVRHSPDLFTNFDTGCGLPSDKIWSMAEVAPEEIWVGTSRNGLARVLPDTCLPLDLIKDIRQTDVHDIIRLRDGRFCFSASGQGIYLGGDKKWKKIPFASGLSLQTIMDICETTEAHGGSEPLFLASFNGILQVRNDSLRLAQFANGTMQLDVNAIVADNDAHYWAASSNGLWCIHRKQPGDSLLLCTQLPVSSGLQGQKITAVNVTHTHLYAGTQGSGVRIFDLNDIAQCLLGKDTTLTPVIWNERNGLNSDHITALFTDTKGNCWIGTTRGINRLDAIHVGLALEQHAGGKIPFENFGVSAGLVDPEVTYHHVLESADGHIWFTTNSALVRYNPGAYFSDSQPPSVSLTSMRLFFDEIDWKKDERMHEHASLLSSYFSDYMYTKSMVPFASLPMEPVFSYNLNHLTFEFAPRDWCFNQSVSLYIRLEGADANWNAIPSGTITYSSLAPGHYVLRYKAVNGAGLESEEETFSFTIMPPLWQTKGFLIAMGVLLSALLFGLYKWRVRMLERDKKMLEVKVAERTEELRLEKDKSDNLLLNILPMQTAVELKEKGEAATRTYEHVSVLFTDFEGFTRLSGTMDSGELVRVLDRYFKAFDRISSQYRIEKIKTIGDAYMCASGLFNFNKSHAAEMVAFGLELLNAVQEINDDRASHGETPWRIRIGIHSGPVIAGVVGKKKFAYDIWGDTVNTASRMESSGEPGKLNISGATADACGPYFDLTPRGQVPIKGKGMMEMYFVRGFRPGYASAGNDQLPSDLFRSEVITFK